LGHRLHQRDNENRPLSNLAILDVGQTEIDVDFSTRAVLELRDPATALGKESSAQDLGVQNKFCAVIGTGSEEVERHLARWVE